MKNLWLRLISTCIVASFVVGIFMNIDSKIVDAASTTDSKIAQKTEGAPYFLKDTSVEEVTYTEYIDKYKDFKLAAKEIEIFADCYAEERNSGVKKIRQYKNLSNVLEWKSQNGSVLWEFAVPSDGLYQIDLVYCPLDGRENNIILGLKLDGKYKFNGMKKLVFPRLWKNDGEIRVDDNGNEFAPPQVEIGEFTEYSVRDQSWQISTPYVFALSEGEHTLELEAIAEPFVLHKIKLSIPEQLIPYEVVKDAYKSDRLNEYMGNDIVIQGEQAQIKTTRALISLSDNSEASVEPSDAYKNRINYIGSSNWKTPGEIITWKFEVKKAGLYKLGFRFRQNCIINGLSYRSLKIDGKTPFEEASRIAFPYDSHWQFMEYGDAEGTPYVIYLTEGIHELSLGVTLGELAAFSRRLEDIAYKIGNLYLKIAMITGETPDPNRDYDLFRQIPEFNEILQKNYDELNSLTEEMRTLTGKRGSNYVAALQNMARVLKNMLRNPYTAQQYKSDYYANYCCISSWLYEMRKLPLDIDEIRLGSPSVEFKNQMAGMLDSVKFKIQRFIASFTEKHNIISGVKENNKEIKLWVNWGQDQAQVINSLIQDSFTPEYGINVKVEVVNASLIQGILSGNQPDCALMMSRTEPINLAIRGGLYDLKNFKDYGEVTKRFQPSAMVPYELEDGCYALPDSQSFYMMFYRTDVFNDMGIAVPKTWDEFLEAAAAIQRNNMQISLPYIKIENMTTVNTGIGGLNLYAALLKQHGLNLYNEAGTACMLDTPEAIKVFSEWTDYYTKLKFPIVADFYNRFRVGLMPLGVQPYNMYSILSAAAPEIKDRWEMVPIPGIEMEDGTVNNAEAGAGTGAVILKKSRNKDAAWKFIKWWTSAETQLRYSNNVESILGVVGRHATSNIEAFSKIPWTQEELDRLNQQWSMVKELPELPGGYYAARALDQAFWAVVNKTDTSNDAMLKWGYFANREIERKLKQYGFVK